MRRRGVLFVSAFLGVLFCTFAVLRVTEKRAHAFYFADDQSALNFLVANCNPGGPRRTIHILYATNVTMNGTDLTFMLKGRSYNCGTTTSPNVSNTLTSFTPVGVGVPHTMYAGLSLPVNTSSAVYQYGPFTYTNLSPGTHTFTYTYRVTSYDTSAVGTSTFTVTIPQPVNHQPTGTLSANCNVASGTFSDQDHPGPYAVRLHFKNSSNTYTTYTDAANRFSYTVPAAYKDYNGGAATQVWAEGLGLNADGSADSWVSMSGSPASYGPCTNASCESVQFSLNGGPLQNAGYGGVITASALDTLTVRLGWRNSAPAGGITWNNLGGHPKGTYDAGWDPSSGTYSQYDGSASNTLYAVSPGSSVGVGGVGYFNWNPGPLQKIGVYDQKFKMIHENVEWFGGDCRFTLQVKYADIGALGVLSCDLSDLSGNAEVGDSLSPSYKVIYHPVADPALYPVVSFTNPLLSMSPAGFSNRLGSPPSFILAPVPGGTNQPVSFLPAVTFASGGTYTFNGSVAYSAPNGIGGTVSGTKTCVSNKTVGERPYIKVYGGETGAGLSFADPCAFVTSGIYGSAKNNGSGWIGAGDQFAARANGSIVSFASASLFAPAAPSTLIFANATSAPPSMGGGYATIMCAPSYWPSALPANGSSILTSGTKGVFALPSGSTLTQTSDLTHAVTVYVQGNLFINSDIKTVSNWTTTAEIALLNVIVKGNIYIAPGVHELDGTFVAVPTDPITPTDGRIFTCYKDTADPADLAHSGLWIANNCGSQLRIIGSLQAAKVNFLRTKGTVNKGTVAEQASSGNIAEVIQSSPELFMGTPALPYSDAIGYSSILSLSPSL